jgi:general secretion pathway protein G
MGKLMNRRNRAGFSLIELVIVVVIIAVIGAIAIPRMSRGAAGAADSALVGDLAVLRNAIDLYAAEHGGEFPGDDGAGALDASVLVNQLTQFSTNAGATSATKDATHIYGPYLRKIPPLPVGTNKGKTAIHAGALGTANFGWQYTLSTGGIKANLADAEKDVAGTQYNAF